MMKKLTNYTYENLEVNKSYSSYKELCEVLSAKYANKEIKIEQFKEWSRYFNFTKQGNQIAIHEIYKEPIPLEQNEYSNDLFLVNRTIKRKPTKVKSEFVNVFLKNPLLTKWWMTADNGEIPNPFDIRSTNVYWWKCDVCSNEFQSSVLDLFDSRIAIDVRLKCPCCNLSKYAKEIFYILKYNGILFDVEHFYPDLIGLSGGYLRFDFAILDDDCNVIKIVEYDGEYHDTDWKVKQHDELKNEYCELNNIPLLRIHHSDKNNIISKLSDFIGMKVLDYPTSIKNMEIDNKQKQKEIKLLKEQIRELEHGLSVYELGIKINNDKIIKIIG